jgi:PAS domain S-box-containing protein
MKRASILIVEDQEALAKTLANLLSSLGYQVLPDVSTGEEAVATARGLKPDLVLMDIYLEGDMDGIEAAEQISSELDIPVIYMTGYADEITFERATKQATYGYIVKPFEPKQLKWAIEFALYKQKAERQLKESEEKYKQIAELVPQMLYEADLEGKITFINRSGLQTTGYTLEDFERGVAFFEVLVPEDHPRMIRHMDEVRTRRRNLGEEYTVVRKDGTTFPVITYAGPIVRDNEVVGFRGIAIDTTDLKDMQKRLQEGRDELEHHVAERTEELLAANKRLQLEIEQRKRADKALRQSEERFRAIFEAASDCIFIKDRDLTYTHVNPAMEKLLGISTAGLVGKTDDILFPESRASMTREVDSRVLEGNLVEEELTILANAMPLTLSVVKYPMYGRDGHIIGLCGIARDITERKKAQETSILSEVASRLNHNLYSSPAVCSMLNMALVAAETDSTILLLGESGSGKDHVARFIHDHSKRASGPYFIINCASLPAELAESELFGHEAGAFTGARSRKRGLLELAAGGTLLLNEVAELSLAIQAKLLTFLDSREFTRVGGEKKISVNTRILAATNRDLAEQVGNGQFRSDLFFRLNVISLSIPPLRDRIEDLPILVEQLVSELAWKLRLPSVPHISANAIRKLSQYSWPGNIRELRNILERTLILSGTGPLRLDLLESKDELAEACSAGSSKQPLNELVGDLQLRLVKDALTQARGNKQKAAHLLGISRYALRRLLKKWDLMDS